MTKRMMVALGAALAIAGSAFAQQPAEEVPTLPAPALSAPAAPEPAATSLWPFGPVSETNANGRERFWATSDVVAAWFSGDHLPILVTTSPAGTPLARAGVLGTGSTTTLFGNSNVNDDSRLGFRLGAGCWLDDERRFGVEAGFTMLESQATLFSAASDGTTILARPFTDVTTNLQQASLIAFPGNSSGNINVRASSGNFYEFHLDFSENVVDNGWLRMDALLGYKFYRYDEGLRINQNVMPTGANFVTGTQVATQDEFDTRNSFNGGDFGLRTQFTRDNFSLGFLTKLSVGDLNRTVNISGSQVATVPGAPAPVTQVGGIYALKSNIGSHPSSDWEVLPEFGVNLGWRASPNVKVTLGYSIFLLDQIAQAGNQIDTSINPALFPPASTTPVVPNRPVFILDRTNVWVQNLNLGLEFSY